MFPNWLGFVVDWKAEPEAKLEGENPLRGLLNIDMGHLYDKIITRADPEIDIPVKRKTKQGKRAHLRPPVTSEGRVSQSRKVAKTVPLLPS